MPLFFAPASVRIKELFFVAFLRCGERGQWLGTIFTLKWLLSMCLQVSQHLCAWHLERTVWACQLIERFLLLDSYMYTQLRCCHCHLTCLISGSHIVNFAFSRHGPCWCPLQYSSLLPSMSSTPVALLLADCAGKRYSSSCAVFTCHYYITGS